MIADSLSMAFGDYLSTKSEVIITFPLNIKILK